MVWNVLYLRRNKMCAIPPKEKCPKCKSKDTELTGFKNRLFYYKCNNCGFRWES